MQAIATLLNPILQTSPADTPKFEEIHPVVAGHVWKYKPYSDVHSRALMAARSFVSAALNRHEPRWLTLLGPSGVGKTHLLRQALKLCHRLVTVNGWPRELSIAHVVPALDLDNYLAPKDFSRFDVVFIEDIAAGEKGAAKVTRDRIAELLQLRSRKFTLIDGNFGSIGEVEKHFDGRIASRLRRDLSECLIFPPSTPDFSTL